MNCEINPDKPLTKAERMSLGALAFWAILGVWAILSVCGCATKTRTVEVDGMFTEASAGLIGIGSVDVMASPVGEETLVGKYQEDTAWLSPSTKVRSMKLQLTGTNTCAQAEKIVRAICEAFMTNRVSIVTK